MKATTLIKMAIAQTTISDRTIRIPNKSLSGKSNKNQCRQRVYEEQKSSKSVKKQCLQLADYIDRLNI